MIDEFFRNPTAPGQPLVAARPEKAVPDGQIVES
jgi:hypothetical protein